MAGIARRFSFWLAAAVALSACGSERGGEQGAAGGPRTPEQIARLAAAGMGQAIGEWALLRPAAGLAAADYEAFGPATDEPAAMAANGAVATAAFAGRAGLVFAAPREGTATRAALPPESGVYMSPALGRGVKIAYGATQTGQAAWVVGAQGYMALDATTTVLSLILLDPALASPDPEVQQAQATWLVGRVTAGWPAVTTAALAYDAALAQRRDPAADPAFAGALVQARSEAFSAMPEAQPPAHTGADSRADAFRRFAALELAGRFVEHAADPDAKVKVRVASAGRVVSHVTPAPIDDKRTDLEVGASRGTAVDLYYTVYRIDKKALPPGSTALGRPQLTDRLPRQGALVRAGVIAADSWWGYLDVFGNLVSLATDQALAFAGSAYEAATGSGGGGIAEAGEALEIRVFSGGFGNGQPPEIAAHVQGYFAAEAAIAYRQNVAMTVVELLLAIPGADAILGEEFGPKVIQAAIAQAFRDLETLAATRGTTGDGLAATIMEVCGNAAKAALDTAIQEATAVKRQLRGGWKKLFSFVGSGGRKLLKTVGRTLSGGWVCKGGKVANRIARMARPYSLMELHVADVGGGACTELLAMAAKEAAAAGEELGLRFPTICEDCLETACQGECQAAIDADMRGLDACHSACSAATGPCLEKLRAEATACNQRCGQARTAACANDPSCLFRVPGECMRECKPFDAVGGGPCFANLNPCFADCDRNHTAAKAAEEGFFGCVQRACPGQCEPAKP